jgi:putative transcriptional regulator
MDTVTGQLLIAGPTLLDPNFARTVVLVARHGEEGALGVVLNRPAEVTVGDAVPELTDVLDGSDPMWVGGPVQPTGVVVLAEWDDPSPESGLVTGEIGLLAARQDVEELAAGARRARAYAGYTGWGPGQLDSELEREDWIVSDTLPEDVFTEDPDDLWSAVLRRKGGSYGLVATMPLDPSVN